MGTRSRSLATARRSETIAQKADAYGMPGILVDGNDLLATYEVTQVAVERARAGGGPSLIEALTYRAGPHTTNDDPHRYRTAEEEASWEGRDPIERVRLYLEREKAWDGDWQAEIEKVTTEELEVAVAEAESVVRQDHRSMFDSVFAEPTVPLERQYEELDRYMRDA